MDSSLRKAQLLQLDVALEIKGYVKEMEYNIF